MPRSAPPSQKGPLETPEQGGAPACGSKRGRDVQRVGLSATVGNPGDILRWVAGSSRRAGVVVDPGGSRETPEIAIDWVATMDNAAKMIAQMTQTPSTESSGATGITRCTRCGNQRLSKIPNTTGTITTCKVCLNNIQVSTGTSVPANNCVSRGVSTIAASVEQTVITTDNATSALAMYETKLEAAPPGQHPTRINPTAK